MICVFLNDSQYLQWTCLSKNFSFLNTDILILKPSFIKHIQYHICIKIHLINFFFLIISVVTEVSIFFLTQIHTYIYNDCASINKYNLIWYRLTTWVYDMPDMQNWILFFRIFLAHSLKTMIFCCCRIVNFHTQKKI